MTMTLEDYMKDRSERTVEEHKNQLAQCLVLTYGGFFVQEKKGLRFFTKDQLSELLYFPFKLSDDQGTFYFAEFIEFWADADWFASLRWHDRGDVDFIPEEAPAEEAPEEESPSEPPPPHNSKFIGGSYKYCLEHKPEKSHYQVHHLISKAALSKWWHFTPRTPGSGVGWDPLLQDPTQPWGPSILMETADHVKTRTYCGPDGPGDARLQINDDAADLIYKADFLGVFAREKEDLLKKFGDKYKDALEQAEQYVKEVLKVRQDEKHFLWIGNKSYHPWMIQNTHK